MLLIKHVTAISTSCRNFSGILRNGAAPTWLRAGRELEIPDFSSRAKKLIASPQRFVNYHFYRLVLHCSTRLPTPTSMFLRPYIIRKAHLITLISSATRLQRAASTRQHNKGSTRLFSSFSLLGTAHVVGPKHFPRHPRSTTRQCAGPLS